MGRPKRKRGGGRVTPKKHRPKFDDERGADFEEYRDGYHYEYQVHPDDADEFQLELLSRDAEYMVEKLAEAGADLDEADYWASCIQSAISTRRSPDGVAASSVVAHAERTAGPTGAVLAAAVAVYGPVEARSGARRALRRIRGSGADVPSWVDGLGRAVPLRATRTTDRWGERGRIRIDFQRPDGSAHTLSVSINPFWLAMASGFLMIRSSPELAAIDGGDRRVEHLSLADARAVVEAGLAAYDSFEMLDEDDDGLFGEGLDVDLRALVEQRLALLPPGGRAPAVPPLDATEAGDHLADFAAQGLRLGEHPREMNDLAQTMVGFAMMCCDRNILRWTPPRVESFLEKWMPDHGLFCGECRDTHKHPPDEEWVSTVESAFPRWLRYAAERDDRTGDALEENLAQARESLKQMRLHATGSPLRVA